MIKKSFKVKIILPTIVILSALVIVLNIFLFFEFRYLAAGIINDKLESNINSMNEYLDDSSAKTKMAAVSMALNPQVQKAIRERDTDGLLRLFTAAHDLYQVNYFTITDDRGMVLARTNEPAENGDWATSQQNIKDALEGKTSTYFEDGESVKVSVRTGAPAYDQDGSLLGVISAGVRFDSDSEVERLKELLHSEITIFYGERRIATTVMKDGQSLVGTTMDPDIAKFIDENKREYIGEVDVYGEEYRIYYKPLFDANNEVFAVFCLGMSDTDLQTATKNVIRDGILLGLAGLGVSILLIFLIMSSISKPISKLSMDMTHIANGNFRVDIDIGGEDEVGNLGKSLQKVAWILHKLLDDINSMIVEHKRGNTDYDLNTEEFQGDYRILADSVSELAAISMQDPMTGLPNRRSFDNRLDLEWNGAIREKRTISILMIDIDNFKDYNDTFGHQQGDVALQTAADAIKRSLKRSIDFAARWGGEEFVVLLPVTDLKGALIVAEGLRAEIENSRIRGAAGNGAAVTASIGVNTQIPTSIDTVEGFVAGADSALYRAKETGKNKICHHNELLSK